MKILLLLIALLPGCATYNAATEIVRTQGVVAADKQMDAAIFLLCRGVTIGAWMRRFGESEASAEAWGVMCANKTPLRPITPIGVME